MRRDAPNRSRTEKEHQELRCNHSFGFVEQVAILNSSVSGFINSYDIKYYHSSSQQLELAPTDKELVNTTAANPPVKCLLNATRLAHGGRANWTKPWGPRGLKPKIAGPSDDDDDDCDDYLVGG